MASISVLSILLALASPAHSFRFDRLQSRSPFRRRGVPSQGFYDPTANGGSFLTVAPGTGGLGEPLNVILSAKSDPRVLIDSENDGGMRNYWISVGFAAECFGQHAGDPQTANIGDGNGQRNETAELRWDYGDPSLGTCKETVEGGNHFRYWIQNGPDANSGAVFMATSYEKPIQSGHDIVFDGYDLGRDWLVGNATAQTSLVLTLNLTDGMTFSGSTTSLNYTYHTEAVYMAGLASNSTAGLNHASSVGGGGIPALDGFVAVLTVNIVKTPSTSGARHLLLTPSWLWAVAITLTSLALSSA